MLRIVLDPYEEYSPFPKGQWKRKRKSRWSGNDHFSAETEGPQVKKAPRKQNSLVMFENRLVGIQNNLPKKKRRWGTQARTKLTVDDINQFQLRVEAVTQINRKLLFSNCIPSEGDTFLDRPEPPPQYDNHGVRTNTLELRYREKLERDRNILMHHLILLNPTYTAPLTYKGPPYEYIMWFPTKLYPETNFIGAILGPRGNTQKRLEKETSCKIAIRGKGAEKNIVRMIRNPKTGLDEDMPNHVYLTAPSAEKLEKGIEAIKPLLKPQNELVRIEQMKELALINGTYRFDMRCKECGEMGHKDFQCPQRKNSYFANVQCEKCGDLSHVTSDCPQKGLFESSQQNLDIEYKQFLAEINGEDPEMARKRAEEESKLEQARKNNVEVFQSARHNTKVTLMKPTTSVKVAIAKDEKMPDFLKFANLQSINQKRSFLTN